MLTKRKSLDLLVNNAAVIQSKELPKEIFEWNEIFGINLRAPVLFHLCCRIDEVNERWRNH